MDPNQTYLELFTAMINGEHKTARELAHSLQQWLRKGGFYPHQMTPEAMQAYLQDVLQRTAYVDLPPEQQIMFYVVCPECQCHVEIPGDAVGPERTDPWNVVGCDECDTVFDYDDEDIAQTQIPTPR